MSTIYQDCEATLLVEEVLVNEVMKMLWVHWDLSLSFALAGDVEDCLAYCGWKRNFEWAQSGVLHCAACLSRVLRQLADGSGTVA